MKKPENITAIFLDLGDTFRVIREDEAYKTNAKKEITRLLGVETDAARFFDEVIEVRYQEYRKWALATMCEAPENLLWTWWLAFDFPKDSVKKNAMALTYQYRQTKGERVVVDGGVETVKELQRRGYKLGIVSDLVGTQEVDEWLDRDQLRPYFCTVQQSSVTLIRKPHPAIFFYAVREAGVDPGNGCFVGDNLDRDIAGAKQAGFGYTIGVRYEGKRNTKLEITEENRPDAFITHFSELLGYFPTID